jgi:hypothetical protein
VHTEAGEQNLLEREIFVTAGAELEHLLNGSKRTIHLGMTSLITADIITIVTNKSNQLLTKIDTLKV